VHQRYAAAARFYADALADRPALGDDLQAGHRSNAARAVVLTAAGAGADAVPLGDEDRARMRRQALGWLRADLVLWGKEADTGTPQARAAAAKTLGHWEEDPDLAGVRDPAALAKLPKEERAGWKKLWADVGEMRRKAGMKQP
jgi:serine/threonine-protein kinase